ncbi:hypothetical protein [Lysinibacillus xylanilyticus]|uniref:hypothetical protein n=1 Tax=Lysinibacillus xylanilyticus TaxID=582475 RepID=UPI0012FE5946|nr:hypothetical protein [Lysinibacillus xylanilyticus]
MKADLLTVIELVDILNYAKNKNPRLLKSLDQHDITLIKDFGEALDKYRSTQKNELVMS